MSTFAQSDGSYSDPDREIMSGRRVEGLNDLEFRV